MTSFAGHHFTSETYKDMCALRDAALENKSSRNAYEHVCDMLVVYLRRMLDLVSQGFVYMQHPEQNFNTQEHLVKPWNNLLTTRTHACFVCDAIHESKFDLDEEIFATLLRFEETFKEHMLKPLANLFDIGDYSGAEGVRLPCTSASILIDVCRCPRSKRLPVATRCGITLSLNFLSHWLSG